MAVAYRAIFLRWDANTYHRAVKCLRDGHRDEMQAQASELRRTLNTGALRGKISDTWMEWQGIMLLQTETSETVNNGTEDVPVAILSELRGAYVAKDLEVMTHSGTSYRPVRWVSKWLPALEFDPLGQYQTMPVVLWAIEP